MIQVPYQYAHSDELSAAYLQGYCAIAARVIESMDKKNLKEMVERACWQAFRCGRDYENSDEDRAERMKDQVKDLIDICHRKIDGGNDKGSEL